jgi:hypothetical protein
VGALNSCYRGGIRRGRYELATDCDWQVIEGFRSDDEYRRVLAQLVEQVRTGAVKEVRVSKRYSGIDWDEQWFTCKSTRETWRLVAPDPPFEGVFKPV